MFRTIGNTFALIGSSWRVLQEDRRLVLFPIASVACALVLCLMMLGAFSGMGTLDRIDGSPDLRFHEIVLALATYAAIVFIAIYFNAALIAVALERLRGGNPSLRFGLQASRRRVWSILGWAVIAASVELVLRSLRDGDELPAKIIGWVVSAVWGFMTFFVVPILVVEGVGPFEAMRRSTSLLSRTWGSQVTAGFSFFLAYVALFFAVAAPIVLGAMIAPEVAVLFGVLFSLPLAVAGFASVIAMEGIFKAVLYRYASSGEVNGYFSEQALRAAYEPKAS